MRIRTLTNPFNCQRRFSKPHWPDIFPEFNGTLDVEIGIGKGDFIIRYADTYPERSIVGYEIRCRAYEEVLERVGQRTLKNIHLGWGNGQTGLEDMFEDNSIDRIFVFHPDPWPKNKHSNRRLISPEFLDLAYAKLKPGGCLYVATDVAALWDHMYKTIIAHNKLTLFDHDTFWQEHYQSRWRDIGIENQRSLHYGTFKK